MATLGAEPVIMLTAPAPTSQRALAKAGMSVKDIDLWEINEAFAAVVLQTIRKLDLDPERVNVNGLPSPSAIPWAQPAPCFSERRWTSSSDATCRRPW